MKDLPTIINLLVGIGVFVISLYFTIRHFRVVRSVSYIERLNTPEMIQIRAVVQKWASSDKSNAEKMIELENDEVLEMKVRVLYSIFTEIGIAYRHWIVVRSIVCDIYNPIVPQGWKMLEPYILYKRKNGVLFGFSFMNLNMAILKHQKNKWKDRSRKFNKGIEQTENTASSENA